MPRKPNRPAYRLNPEMVPSDLWGRSAYRMLGGRAAWRKQIRPDALAKSKDQCETCGDSSGTLVCHDRWVYDDKKAIATLSGFEIHCRGCDSVTHFGRMFKIGADLTPIFAHVCRVNECNFQEAVTTLKDACLLWEKRDKKKWRIVVASALLKTYPELAELPSFRPAAVEYA
jgi:hypothetical protein